MPEFDCRRKSCAESKCFADVEPNARLLPEGREAAVLDKWSKQIAEAIKRQVGA